MSREVKYLVIMLQKVKICAKLRETDASVEKPSDLACPMNLHITLSSVSSFLDLSARY